MGIIISIITGIIVSIGAIIDKAQSDKYIQKRPCTRAREMLVLMWLIFGYILTISYKSVLRSNLIHIEYENPIDSIDDALQSGKQIFVARDVVFTTDQRTRVKELAKRVIRFELIHGRTPLWVVEG